MSRIGALILLILAAFYVAWPAYTGYRIAGALDAGDTAVLESAIDFPSVRQSLRPAVAEKVDQSLKSALKSGGSGGSVLLDQVRKDVTPKIVDGALDGLVTPQALIRIHKDGRSFKDTIERTVAERPELVAQIGGLIGGLLGRDIPGLPKPAATAGNGSGQAARTAGGTKPEGTSLGLGNIKSVALDGPWAISVGVARDAKVSEPDVTATFGFTGTDWRLTGLVPKL